jgi:hypothetical protein
MTKSDWLRTETVVLRNGVEAQEALASWVCRTLVKLMRTDPFTLCELAQLSFGLEFKLMDCAAEKLQALKLVERTADGYRIPDSVYDVVICAIPDPLGRLLQSPKVNA